MGEPVWHKTPLLCLLRCTLGLHKSSKAGPVMVASFWDNIIAIEAVIIAPPITTTAAVTVQQHQQQQQQHIIVEMLTLCKLLVSGIIASF